MPKFNGTEIVVAIEDASTPGTFVVLAGQRDYTLDLTATAIDASCKDFNDAIKIPGRRDSTLTLDAAWIDTDAAYLDLQAAYFADPPTLVKVQAQKDGTPFLEADAVITSLGQRAPDNDLATTNIELSVTGGWTQLP